jgi:hypothetical protein
VEAVALVLVGSLITIAWPAIAWPRERKDRARADAHAVQAAKRSVAADWLAHAAYLQSTLAVGRIVARLLLLSDLERGNDERLRRAAC